MVVALSAPVLALPFVGLLPDQAPEAVQLLALLEDQLSIADPPLLTLVGVALRLTVGATTAAFTVMAKAVKEAVALPSLTLITMPEVVPTSAATGVPASCPFVVLKLAHEGLFWMLKVSVSPSVSAAEGWNR